MAEQLLQQALELDIEAEVERRFEAAKREIEESRNLESARSTTSALNNRIGSSYGKTKSVSFEPSVHSRITKPTTASTERTKLNVGTLQEVEDSIAESIQIAESYSQSMRSQSAAEISSKPKDSSSRKLKDVIKASNDSKFSPQRNPSNLSAKTSEKGKGDGDNKSENDNESVIESDYSQDFTEQSITSKDIS